MQAVLLLALLGSALADVCAHAQTPRPADNGIINLTTPTGHVRAKAQPDECFVGIGQNAPFTQPACSQGQPKVNQAYVWAMTSAGDDIWFGTIANTRCLVQGTILSLGAVSIDTPYQTNSWVCEFGKSPYVPPLPASVGDFRPPRMYVYNVPTQILTEVTPAAPPRS